MINLNFCNKKKKSHLNLNYEFSLPQLKGSLDIRNKTEEKRNQSLNKYTEIMLTYSKKKR